MNRVLRGLIQLLAPLTPYTAEEAFHSLRETGSVHTGLFPAVEASAYGKVVQKWQVFLDVRSRVNEKLEEARREKKIGKSLEACVEITTNRPPLGTAAATTETATMDAAMLEELFIVTKVVII